MAQFMEISEVKSAAERIEDVLREIGVLLIAFAPLDVALNHHQEGDKNFLLLFLGLGTSLFTGALILEKRRGKDQLESSSFLLLFWVLGVILMMTAFLRGLGV